MAEFTRPLSALRKTDAKLAGGKGANLGEMLSAGIPVPPGFVVLAPAFEWFLEESDLGVEVAAWLHKVKYQDTNSVERASEEIRALFEQTPMPKDIAVEILKAHTTLKAPLVAVRSSATAEDSKAASWAGELESYLDVKKATVLKRVKECWSSLFTPRAIVYRKEQNLHKTGVAVAVVVQKMVQSELAGVCFTVHPVTKDRNQMVLEAVWGLGEGIVGGRFTPDSYVLDRRDFSLIDVNVSEQRTMIARKGSGGTEDAPVPAARRRMQKLAGAKLKQLAQLCLKIEKHYAAPQDIEFAVEKGKQYIVQTRPITTL
ncbi:MAG: hypothetical protein HYZ09_00745 [Candidatus Kerfeldbacteria bacterium]|nr:hypothetical protein [Candidatus Kerfeldbacteria bacterium]